MVVKSGHTHTHTLSLTHYNQTFLSSQDYHSLLFGSGRNVASLANNVTSSLCLPISIQEVLDMNQATQMDTMQSEVQHT